ncbi:MAG: ABC transporter permease [Janthinobacterium lividum]
MERLDTDYQAQYVAERRVAVLTRYFAGLVILISALDLLGLAAFTAERWRKEIGVRKALGVSELGIVWLFRQPDLAGRSGHYAGADPELPAHGSKKGFAYRVAWQWWYSAAAGIGGRLIAWLTVSLLPGGQLTVF